MGDEVPCTWQPVIAYQGLCATSSETLLTRTVGPVNPDQDICIAIQHHDNPMSQHGIASYVTKFESQSFKLC